MARIAFIGLGNMGGGMCANLVKAGHAVKAFDLNAQAVAKSVEAGAVAASSIADAVGDAEYVVSMLPAGKHVEAVYFGDDGVVAGIPAGALFIDCSTIAVTEARDLIAKAQDAGFEMVDAPVSGGTAAAEAGTLTFMTGGTEAAFKRAELVLKSMGKNIFHAGGPGNGQVAKVANNMLLAISMIGTCEAFNLAEKLGMDGQTFFDISSKASGQNWSMTSYCPVPGPVPTAPSNRDYQPGFAVAMMLKDLNLADAAAKSVDAETRLGDLARTVYSGLDTQGHGGLDFSCVMKDLRQLL